MTDLLTLLGENIWLVAVATLRRSTTLHQQIEKYEKSLQKAEEASQSKTTFLSRMSHEIRTPDEWHHWYADAGRGQADAGQPRHAVPAQGGRAERPSSLAD